MESRRARPAGFCFRRGASGPGTAPVTAAAVKKATSHITTAGGRAAPLMTDTGAQTPEAPRPGDEDAHTTRPSRPSLLPPHPLKPAASLGPKLLWVHRSEARRSRAGSRFTSHQAKGCKGELHVSHHQLTSRPLLRPLWLAHHASRSTAARASPVI
jgi:hypothetical protein